MGRRVTVTLILLGLFLFVGSCVPLGVVVYHEVLVSPSGSFSLAGPGSYDEATFKGRPGELVRFAVEANISTASVQENPDSISKDYQARFRFPISYSIRDSNGNSLISKEVILAWKDGESITKSNEQTSSAGGTLKAITHLDKFTLPSDGISTIEIDFSPDTTYQASINSPMLYFYEGMIDNTRYVSASVVMFVAGFILAMVGFIFTVSNSTKLPAPQPIVGQQAMSESGSMRDKEINQQAMFIQLSALSGYVVPFGSIIFPVVLWMVWRDKDPYLNEMGREAVNFQLSMLVYYLICVVLFFVLIGMLLIVAAMIFHLTYIIIASVQTSRGIDFRYPLNMRFIKA